MKHIDNFKFEYCANHYDGCNSKPTTKLGFKEYCIDCFVKIQYQELTYAIKYGKYKNSFKITHNPRCIPQVGAFENRNLLKKDH
jgi:hypothetical protein